MSDLSCRHDMCDLCGVRVCDRPDAEIKRYGPVKSCSSCVRRSVGHLYDAAVCMGFGVIDVNKPCPQKVRGKEQSRG
jgi:hypothetical protein